MPEATLSITPGGAINASTYNTASFVVDNTSGGAIAITRLRIDLSGALFPDLVYDPDGTAGDTVAKCFTADFGASLVGLVAPADPCADPFQGPHSRGFDILQIDFDNFLPGRSFSFSVDVDPTSIQGATAPGPGEAGSVSGLELSNAAVEVTFDTGATLAGRCFADPGSDGSCSVVLSQGPPAAPVLSFPGLAPPETVVTPGQTARVEGPPGAQVVLLQVEGALFTEGLQGGGFDIDPFEANSAVRVAQYDVTLPASGSLDVPVTLTRSDADGGLNYFTAVVRDPAGGTGLPAPVMVIDYDDCAAPPPRSVTLQVEPAGLLTWTPLPGALSYDVVEGDLALLRAGAMTASVLGCLADNVASRSASAAAPPPAVGQGFYYLVRGVGCGGNGTWDAGAGTGQAGSRDAAIDAAAASCP